MKSKLSQVLEVRVVSLSLQQSRKQTIQEMHHAVVVSFNSFKSVKELINTMSFLMASVLFVFCFYQLPNS